MRLLGVDIGTTHCKAGLFEEDGTLVALASRATIARRAAGGNLYYDPGELVQGAISAVREVAAAGTEPIGAAGIASMSETGLLIDRRTGRPRSFLVPWHDTSATAQAAQIAQDTDLVERFCRTGTHLSWKCGLAKLLWLRDQGTDVDGAVWLSAADYIAYHLTGKLATDYSLANRTYAFRIDTRSWDEEFLRRFGLQANQFPEALPAGQPMGSVRPDEDAGLAAGTPVAVVGHDHVVAALATGAIQPGLVLDSIGTAETLVGTLDELALGKKEFDSGLYYGCHTARDRYYWMGSQSSAGGSVEWILEQLADKPLSYEELGALLQTAKAGPTGIMYLPYLSGSRFPHPDPSMKGTLAGLASSHRRADILKAVLEGTAYEMELIRSAAEETNGLRIERMAAVGGGARNPYWMQIKADLSGCRFDAWIMPEAVLLGAALLAGIGRGLFADEQEALAAQAARETRTFAPDPERQAAYRRLYEQGYLRLREALLPFYRAVGD